MDIKKIIEAIEKKKNKCYIGRKYYYYKPDNESGYVNTYQNCKVHTFEKDNTKEVYTNWFKVLVNQKIDYSLSKPITITELPPQEFNIEDIIDELTLNASLDKNAWLHTYINDNNKLDWIVVKDSQIIDIWDDRNKYIKSVIRYWVYDEDKDKEISQQRTHVEVWTPETLVTFDIKDKREYNIEQKNHYFEVLKYQDVEEAINPKNFGFIPFIPLFNNKNKESDIEGIQILLDVYNEICTGFINNVRKFQEMVMKLKGYGAQDIDKFLEQLKKYKVIPLDDDGEFDYLKVDIPTEARSILLEICRKNIFILGRGVDPTDDMGGSNITNVLIKSKYANLDMKCSDMEKQIRRFYRQLILYLNLYYKINIDNEIKFNRTQIFNETEQIDNCIKSMGVISKRTIMENHPWINDVDEELRLIEEDEKEEIQALDKQKEIDKTMIDNNDKTTVKTSTYTE